ncbi:MAG: TrmH family RNA methyltransferase [Kiritimatiellia bacterium]|jgi:TrmH family RNA methyltransferase
MTPPRPPLEITSPANPKIKEIAKLRQRSHRDAAGALLVEGYREIKRALDNGYKPRQIVVCPALYMGTHEPRLVERCTAVGADVLICTPPVFEKISARDRPDGLIAIGPQLHTALADLALPPDALVIVAEAIEKPGNLGTILRSADSAGAAAVIVCDACTDIQNPNVVRASIGTLFALPVVDTTSTEAIAYLRERGFRILAATPHATALYTDYDLTGPTAIVVGAEQYGLSDAWLKRDAILPVRIPMLGQCDSLNVASATTILLYEAVRQRVAKNPAIVPPPHLHEPGGDDPHAID